MNATDPTQTDSQAEQLVEETLVAEDLIEEISIDGMCGVY
jgi:mycofactocin precursor